MGKVYKAKWIFNKHTKDMDTLYDVLRYLILRSDSKKESTHMITQRLKETNKYKPRTTDKINSEKEIEILEEYAKQFQEKYPNLIVINAVIHLDEQTPHLQVKGI